MQTSYGPWATKIDVGNNPRLSAFWRHRLNRLSSVSRSSAGLSQAAKMILGLTALTMGGIPTFAGRAISGEAGERIVAAALDPVARGGAHAARGVAKASASRIEIDIRFVGGDAQDLKRAGAKWTFVPSGCGTARGGSGGKNSAPAPTPAPGVPSPWPLDPPMNPLDVSPHSRTQVVIEKNRPLMFEILDERATAKAVQQWQAKGRVNILSAPRITVRDGQVAYLSDTTQTPFVEGLTDNQPQIRVVSEGTVVTVRPLELHDGRIKLEFAIRFSKIRDVEVIEDSPSVDEKHNVVVVPEVKTIRAEGKVVLAAGQWLLVGGLQCRTVEGKSAAIEVMMQPRKLGS